MATILRYLEFLSLGTWVGSIIFLSFVVAPGAFATLGSRDQAGAVVGMALGRLHLLGLIAGVLFLVARAARSLFTGRGLALLASPAALAVLVMLLLTLVSQSEEHTSELQSPCNLVCRLLLEKKKKETLR